MKKRKYIWNFVLNLQKQEEKLELGDYFELMIQSLSHLKLSVLIILIAAHMTN